MPDDPAPYAKRAATERRQLIASPQAEQRMRSLLAAPLIVDDRVLGVITIQSNRAGAYGEREELILRTLSAYGAIALANAQALAQLKRARSLLEEFAYFDPLTSLPNRRRFLEFFRQLTALAKRTNARFALLLIDLDRFKRTNDTMGHDAGDALLVEAAARLKGAIRESDSIARVGGDEFAILLANIDDPASVDLICGRIVESFIAPLPYKGYFLATSPSIGIALYPDDAALEDTLYKFADLALFAAKRAGRNTWRWHGKAVVEQAGDAETGSAEPLVAP